MLATRSARGSGPTRRYAPSAAIFAAGAQRISIGGQLTWVAAAAAAEAALAIRDEGDFGALRARLQGTDWLR